MTAKENFQTGYVGFVVVIFLFVTSVLFAPFTYKTASNQLCTVGMKPTTDTFVTLPPVRNRDSGEKKLEGGPDQSKPPIQYRLIRSNVPIEINDFFDKEEHTVHYQKTVDGLYEIIYPNINGEKNFYRTYESDRYNTGRDGVDVGNQFRFRQEGVIFFVHLDASGNPIKTSDGNNYIVDMYQDVEVYSMNKDVLGYEKDEVFYCAPTGTSGVVSGRGSGSNINNNVTQNGVTRVAVPNQSVSQSGNEIQLEWLVFVRDEMTISAHCKPAVYLYPPQKMLVNVKVKPNGGYLTYTDPQYDSKKGWSVEAYPDGTLFPAISHQPSAISYPYLYFESKVPDEVFKKPEKGWVVKKEQLNSLYQEVLPKLGLNKVQVKDFTEYWSRSLPESAYYFVGVIDPEGVDNIEKLEITPKPDSVNRVRIYFERLDDYKQVEEPTLDEIQDSTLRQAQGRGYKIQEGLVNPESEIMNPGFKVVEWGGMIKNDPNHPFTCSQ